MEAKMKALFVSLAVLLFAFFLGCENSITDPAANTESYASKDYTSTFPGFIELKARLEDPRTNVNTDVDLKGAIKYKVEIVYPNETSSGNLSAYRVNLNIDALLKSRCPADDEFWKVQNRSVDLVYKIDPLETVYYLNKSFRVQSKCPSPIDLLIKFEVNDKSLKIVSMELKVVNGWSIVGDPES